MARARTDAYLLQVLTTEHFALQTARSATVAEANGRTSLFISTVAAALVATAFVGQASTWGPQLWGFILVVLPVVVFLGVVTFVRLLETSMHDMAYVQRINRIRRFYLELAPEFQSILESPIDDDPSKLSGILRSGPSWWRSLLSSAGMVEVVTSTLVGVFCALFAYQYFGWSPTPTSSAIGASGFLLSLAAHLRYQVLRAEYARQLFAVSEAERGRVSRMTSA